MSAPRLLLCAPASGGGKTTVTCALLQALVNRGAGRWPSSAARTISTPCFTARSSGPKAATWTSSSWAGTPPATCWRKTAGAAAWALIEGVMGYYDGHRPERRRQRL